jgi:hypothetical protein
MKPETETVYLDQGTGAEVAWLRNHAEALAEALQKACDLLDRHEIEIPQSILIVWNKADISPISIANTKRSKKCPEHGDKMLLVEEGGIMCACGQKAVTQVYESGDSERNATQYPERRHADSYCLSPASFWKGLGLIFYTGFALGAACSCAFFLLRGT